MKEERNLPTVRGESTLTIADENIDSVISLSDDTTTWARLVDGGFELTAHGKTVPELVGQLVAVTPYLINFDAGDRVPAKKPHVENDIDIPEGYSRRCDIKLEIGSQALVGLSLAPSSMKHHLSPYLKYLRNQGLRPDEVITRITSKRASNQMGTFNVAVFELVDGDIKRPPASPAATAQEKASEASSDAYPAEWA
jgi:hypothetical protein